MEIYFMIEFNYRLYWMIDDFFNNIYDYGIYNLNEKESKF